MGLARLAPSGRTGAASAGRTCRGLSWCGCAGGTPTGLAVRHPDCWERVLRGPRPSGREAASMEGTIARRA